MNPRETEEPDDVIRLVGAVDPDGRVRFDGNVTLKSVYMICRKAP